MVALPAVTVGARPFEDPASDLDDEAGLLGDRHEHGRHHQTAGGMRPSAASASTPVIRPSRVSTIGWYSVRSSPRVERPAQVALQAGALVGEVLLAQVDDLVPGPAFALRLVHRGVGVLEELLGELVAPTRERDADARP